MTADNSRAELGNTDGLDLRRRRMLGALLRSRRARLSPMTLAMRTGARRRTPGLRREEVAELAQISLEWYTRLEQARDIHISATVISRLARALRLTADEQLHLTVLATPTSTLPLPLASDAAMQAYAQLVSGLPDTPAYLTNAAMDVQAWNGLARVVFGEVTTELGRPNLLAMLFLNQSFRGRFPDWSSFAASVVATFRFTVGRRPHDVELAALEEGLSRESEDFRQLWTRHDVRAACSPQRRVEHPVAGSLDFVVLSFQVGGDVDTRCCVYLPAPGTDTATRLRDLQLADAVASAG